jgi:5-formyltetrahydrofolate cyclo-ligase
MDDALGMTNEDSTAWRRVLRRNMTARRAALAEAEHAAASARIVAHLQAVLTPPGMFAFCWPIKHEPDVRAIVDVWRAAGSRAALPVVLAENTPLAFREW